MKTVYWISAFITLLRLDIVSGQQLQIQPNTTTFLQRLGGSAVFTCLLNAADQIGVIINIRWLNQQGIEINDLSPGKDNTPYVDKSQPLMNKLYIVNIMAKHAGNYNCTAVIGGNVQNLMITLQLFADVRFEDARTPQTPTAYTDALIICRVSGNPIPTVYWRYRGQRVTGDAKYSQEQFGLRVHNISLDDGGIYTCCAEIQSEGVFKSTDIDVIIYYPPAITRGPGQVEGISAQQFTLECVATGNPPPKYEFYKDGSEAPYFSIPRTQVDGDLGVIHFRPLIPEDTGDYECRAFNTAGESRSMGHLHVIVPPTIYNVRNFTATEGASGTLICLSYGDPPPAMTYRKETLFEDYVMGNNEGGRIVLSTPISGELHMTINPLIPTDMANYTCKARNIAGYHERNGSIFVNYAPRINPNQTSMFYNWAGKTRNLTCRTKAWPQPLIEWLRYDRVILNNETYRTYIMGFDSNLQVTVRQVDEGYIYGSFMCRAKNQFGTGTFNVTMRRADWAGPPQAARVIQVTQTTVLLDIDLPVNNGGVPVYGFYIQYMSGHIIEFMLGDPYYIEYLRPHTTYSMIIRARTEVGLGAQLVFDVTTPDVSVPYAINITSDHVSAWPYDYIITWSKPLTGGLQIRDYEFKFRRVTVYPGTFTMKDAVDDWMRRMVQDDYSSPMMYYQLEQLYPSTYYQLQVRAMNDIGWSDPNPTFVFRTADGSQALWDQWNAAARPHSSVGCRTLTILGVILHVFLLTVMQ